MTYKQQVKDTGKVNKIKFLDTEMDTTHLRLVVVDALSATPIKGTLSTQRPLCQCLPVLTLSNRVGTFYFRDDTTTSLAAIIDLQRLQHDRQRSTTTRMKVELKMDQGKKLVASCDLDTFLDGLTLHGFVDLRRKGQILLKLVTEQYMTRHEQTEDNIILDREIQENTEAQSLTNEAQKRWRPKKKHRRRRGGRRQ